MLQGFAKHGEYVDFGESWLVYLTQQGGKKILVDDKEVILGYTGSKQVEQLKNTYIPAYHVTGDVVEPVVLTCVGSVPLQETLLLKQH